MDAATAAEFTWDPANAQLHITHLNIIDAVLNKFRPLGSDLIAFYVYAGGRWHTSLNSLEFMQNTS